MVHIFFSIIEDMILDPESTHSTFSACEFDYTCNTYRVEVTVGCGTVTVGKNYISVNVEPTSGLPKVSAIC